MGRAFVLVCVLLLVLATAATGGRGRRGPRRRTVVVAVPGARSTDRRRSPSRTARTTRWHNSAVTVTFTATSSIAAVADTFVQVDGGVVESTTEVVVQAPRTHADDGEHVAHVLVGGRRTAAPRRRRRVTVKIDTQPPAIRQLRLRPDLLHRVQPVDVGFSLSDISGGARLSYTVLDQYGYLARRGRGHQRRRGRPHHRHPRPLRQRQGLRPGPLPRHAHVHGPRPATAPSPGPSPSATTTRCAPRHVQRQGRRQARRAHLRRRRTRVGVGAHARHLEEVPHARDVLRHRPLRVGGAARRAAQSCARGTASARTAGRTRR